MRARVLLITSVSALLYLWDAVSTFQLFRESNPGFRELNIYVDTSSFNSILLSPAPLAVFLIFLVCLLYAEKNSAQIPTLLESFSLKLAPVFFVFFYLFLKLIVSVNNTLLFYDRIGIMQFFLPLSARFVDSIAIQVTLIYSSLYLLTLPMWAVLTRAVYVRGSGPHSCNQHR